MLISLQVAPGLLQPEGKEVREVKEVKEKTRLFAEMSKKPQEK
jgi:hypothetical protein